MKNRKTDYSFGRKGNWAMHTQKQLLFVLKHSEKERCERRKKKEANSVTLNKTHSTKRGKEKNVGIIKLRKKDQNLRQMKKC